MRPNADTQAHLEAVGGGHRGQRRLALGALRAGSLLAALRCAGPPGALRSGRPLGAGDSGRAGAADLAAQRGREARTPFCLICCVPTLLRPMVIAAVALVSSANDGDCRGY